MLQRQEVNKDISSINQNRLFFMGIKGNLRVFLKVTQSTAIETINCGVKSYSI